MMVSLVNCLGCMIHSFREIRASGDKLEPVMLSRLADVEGRARSDWSRADLALKDAMADVVDKAQVGLM